MKPILINTHDVGGAGKACLRLHQGLLDKNVDAVTLIKKRKDSRSSTVEYKEPSLLKKMIWRKGVHNSHKKEKLEKDYLKTRDPRLELFSFPNSKNCITSQKEYKEADIVNLHWVSGFLDFDRFFKRNTKPVVWTLHDMNPFSGGEHYNELYLGMNGEGVPIKRELSKEDREIQNQIIASKIEAIQQIDNLTIVALCDWMAEEVKKSKVFENCPVHVIPNGLDSKTFKIRDSVICRKKLNLPLEKKIVLFVADSMQNERKGFQYLKKAFERIKDPDVVLCAVGKSNNDNYGLSNMIQLGVIKDESTMSLVYGAADVFVIPSLIDNLPNTIVESLMCGTPVIGFPVGGIRDMIEHNRNGLLTKEISVDALSTSIQSFLDTPLALDSEVIRSSAMLKYDSSVQVKAYLSLFHDILSNVPSND